MRAQRLDANAAIPFLAGYRISVEDDWGWGGFVGAAYARPELGLRVALTYQSKISYDLDTTENSDIFGRTNSTTDVDTPQSVTLEAQTGINEKTLVFGSIRWVDWSEFAIAPEQYGAITGAGPRRAARARRLPRGLVDLQHRRRAQLHRHARGLALASPTSRRSTRC